MFLLDCRFVQDHSEHVLRFAVVLYELVTCVIPVVPSPMLQSLCSQPTHDARLHPLDVLD